MFIALSSKTEETDAGGRQRQDSVISGGSSINGYQKNSPEKSPVKEVKKNPEDGENLMSNIPRMICILWYTFYG